MHKPVPIRSIAICTFICVLCALTPALAAAESMEKLLPEPSCAPGWDLKEKAATFDTETLFDHINGEAELYFPYGFDMLASAAYANAKDPDVWLVADVYRMGSLLDAFGIYSNYRRPEVQDITIGAEGFVSSSQLMFYQDRYFVRLQVTGAMGLGEDVFRACAKSISNKLPSSAGPPGELGAFRIPGIVPKTERYIAKSLLGYAFFRRGITADAVLGGESFQVFMIPEDSVSAARDVLDRYRSYLNAEGKKVHFKEDTVTGTDPLFGGVFVKQTGSYVIGAVRIKNPATAAALILRLQARLGK
ncbi:MAG TPA: DUF6599 family protein [Syntrophales bacterium]|nr:DUF6599 family protein [Syntrophales bacterium]